MPGHFGYDVRMTTFPERLTELRRLKQIRDTSQTIADEAKEFHAQYQSDLMFDMREAGVRSLKTDDAQFVARSTIYGSVQDQDAFLEWCKEHHVTDDYFTDKPSMRRINELVRDRIDANEPPPPGIGFYPREFISITENQ